MEKDVYFDCYGVIYCLINMVNGKRYIGQTTQFFKRMRGYITYKGHNGKLKRAIKKYGLENFSVKILQKCFDEEDLDSSEEYWIKFYESISCGYNLMEGGSHGKHSLETIEKMSGKNSKFYKEIDVEIIIQLFNLGFDTIEISKKLNICTGTIYKRLKEKNISIPWKNRYDKHIDEIIDLLDKGFIQKQISEKLNMSIWSLMGIAKKFNLQERFKENNKKHIELYGGFTKGKHWNLSEETKKNQAKASVGRNLGRKFQQKHNQWLNPNWIIDELKRDLTDGCVARLAEKLGVKTCKITNIIKKYHPDFYNTYIRSLKRIWTDTRRKKLIPIRIEQGRKKRLIQSCEPCLEPTKFLF